MQSMQQNAFSAMQFCEKARKVRYVRRTMPLLFISHRKHSENYLLHSHIFFFHIWQNWARRRRRRKKKGRRSPALNSVDVCEEHCDPSVNRHLAQRVCKKPSALASSAIPSLRATCCHFPLSAISPNESSHSFISILRGRGQGSRKGERVRGGEETDASENRTRD